MIKMECTYLTIFLLLSSAVAQNGNKCIDVGIQSTVDIRLSNTFLNVFSGNINGPLTLECVVELDVPGSVSDALVSIESYVWTRNGDILSGYTERMLRILSLQSSDGGNYGCSAVTDFPCVSVQSDITQVTTAPTVTLTPSSDVTATVGDRIEIVCQADGWPQPTITWRRITSSGTVIDVSTNPELVFDSASMGDSGEYSCVADNGLTEEDATLRQTITLSVLLETAPPPTDSNNSGTDSSSSPSDGIGGNNIGGNNLGRPVIGPTENGFYIAIGVSAFVCLVIGIITVLAVIVWCVRRRKAEKEAATTLEESYEKDNDMQTVETSYMY